MKVLYFFANYTNAINFSVRYYCRAPDSPRNVPLLTIPIILPRKLDNLRAINETLNSLNMMRVSRLIIA